MIPGLITSFGHAVHSITLGTFQKLYHERDTIPALGFAKMIGTSLISASIAGLAARTFSYSAKVPFILSGLTVLAYLTKDYTNPEDGQWIEDWAKQREYIDDYPILEKILNRDVN